MTLGHFSPKLDEEGREERTNEQKKGVFATERRSERILSTSRIWRKGETEVKTG